MAKCPGIRGVRPIRAPGPDRTATKRGDGGACCFVWAGGEHRCRRSRIRTRTALDRLLPRAGRLHRNIRFGCPRTARNHHAARRPSVSRRTRPVQRPYDSGFRPRGDQHPRLAGETGRFPAPCFERAGYCRDHDARIHSTPRRFDYARPCRRGADWPRPRRHHARPAAFFNSKCLPLPADRYRFGCRCRGISRMFRNLICPVARRHFAEGACLPKSYDRRTRRGTRPYRGSRPNACL